MQDIRFARSADGVGIAYAVHGSGPPLLIDKCWLSHLQFDWQSPLWQHYLVELGKIATVIEMNPPSPRISRSERVSSPTSPTALPST